MKDLELTAKQMDETMNRIYKEKQRATFWDFPEDDSYILEVVGFSDHWEAKINFSYPLGVWIVKEKEIKESSYLIQ